MWEAALLEDGSPPLPLLASAGSSPDASFPGPRGGKSPWVVALERRVCRESSWLVLLRYGRSSHRCGFPRAHQTASLGLDPRLRPSGGNSGPSRASFPSSAVRGVVT